MEREFTDQEKVRREKAENIRAMGMDPFGQRFERTDGKGSGKRRRHGCPESQRPCGPMRPF